jgi:dihydroorotase (multifunctional complex type)
VKHALLIRGGRVVSSVAIRQADVRIRDGAVIEVAQNLRPDGERLIDATGLYLLPGVIDAHSHQWEPGFASRPDFRDDTTSAAVGGITTIIDHPLTRPEVLDAAGLRDKAELGERTSLVDFALHAGVTPGLLDAMDGLWAAGATGFKFFTCESGSALKPFTDPSDQRSVLERVQTLGAIALVHAEDQATLDENREQLRTGSAIGRGAFWEWRSPETELAAVDAVLALAHETGARTYIVHASLPESVAAVAAARRRGVQAYAETCPHYLALSTEEILANDQWVTSAPPVRDRRRRDVLRSQLGAEIATIGSDHCSIPRASKVAADPLASLPGVPGNETMLPVMLDLVHQGVLTPERLVALTAEHPAQLFGLSRRKGSLKPGLDGDVSLVSLDEDTVPLAGKTTMAAGWTPYEGRRLRGRVMATIVRGCVVVWEGKVQVDPGFGCFLPREHPPIDF